MDTLSQQNNKDAIENKIKSALSKEMMHIEDINISSEFKLSNLNCEYKT